MDPTVKRLETPDECDQFAENVKQQYPELARQARRRSIELRAAAYGAKSAAEHEALEAVYAYEEALRLKHGRRRKATYTWRKIQSDGIIPAIEHAVTQNHDPAGFTTLKDMGLQNLTYESVVMRHPEAFSAQAVERSGKRLKEWSE